MILAVSSKFNVKSPTFGSLKSNMRLGEKALQQFKKDYPYICSNTYVAMRAGEHINNPKYQTIIQNLLGVFEKYDAGVKLNRNLFYTNLGTVKPNFETIERSVTLNNYANCGEQAVLLLKGFKGWKETP